jgi:capsular polysaccharide biosynthesis protein
LLGTYDLTGKLIRGFEFRRLKRIAGSHPFQKPRKKLRGLYIYGGLLIEHFGHFLLESLSRAWALKAYPQLPVIWQCFPTPKLLTWQIDTFKVLGIEHTRFRLMRRPSKIDTVLLPEAGFGLNEFLHPDQAAALASFPFRAPLSGNRIWLSRSKLPPGTGKVVNEEEIEAKLLARGWQVLHPERVSVAEQLSIISDAETVAGFIGLLFTCSSLASPCERKCDGAPLH